MYRAAPVRSAFDERAHSRDAHFLLTALSDRLIEFSRISRRI
jgi:hypothetical protein